jgi:hypothetical protein
MVSPSVQIPLDWLYLAFGGLFVVLLALALNISLTLRARSEEIHALSKELFGLTKKIEGLTASEREAMDARFQSFVSSLTGEIPTLVSEQTSAALTVAEEKILKHLVSLEPTITKNQESQHKMEELIVALEQLESTVTNATKESLQAALVSAARSVSLS